ncbi:hypothetical protein BDV96DRAFT_554145 [Lophiotrema nucula]|uniref:Uncharacterized protein n=1 Tax=Lophiotrema nucula TaxID=690887 RepID=A0A6A5YTU8_9PLEO|nr:hypothetical protein BDV96DRAFT_554145 [Lophiotrema nucula]
MAFYTPDRIRAPGDLYFPFIPPNQRSPDAVEDLDHKNARTIVTPTYAMTEQLSLKSWRRSVSDRITKRLSQFQTDTTVSIAAPTECAISTRTEPATCHRALRIPEILDAILFYAGVESQANTWQVCSWWQASVQSVIRDKQAKAHYWEAYPCAPIEYGEKINGGLNWLTPNATENSYGLSIPDFGAQDSLFDRAYYPELRLLARVSDPQGVKIGAIVEAMRRCVPKVTSQWCVETKELIEKVSASHWLDDIWRGHPGFPKLYILLDNERMEIEGANAGFHSTRAAYLSAEGCRVDREGGWIPRELMEPAQTETVRGPLNWDA